MTILCRKLFFSCLLFVSLSASSAVVKGKLTDQKTGEPLAGGTVVISNAFVKFSAIVNLDGSFSFNHIEPGTYELRPQYVGYAVQEPLTLVVTAAGETAIVQLKMAETATQLAELNIIGSMGQTDRNARKLERNSDILQNILSAKTIQLLPDITVANALQRVSGVAIQRSSSGEGRYAIIRGMDQRYNNILVNGIKIPSPDAKYRYVPLDLFPSEMLERLEVIKSLTPSMEADAVGGTMNLVMKNAPQQFLLSGSVGSGISALFSGDRPFKTFDHKSVNAKSPAEINGNSYAATQADFTKNNLNFTGKNHPLNATAGVTIGGRLMHQKLGAILSISYQNIYRGSNSTFLVPNAQPEVVGNLDNQSLISTLRIRKYSTQTTRTGLHNKLDFVFNPKHKLSLYNMYVQMNEFQTRSSYDSNYLNRLTDYFMRSREQKQSIYSSSLHGDDIISKTFHFNWTGTYAIAKSKVPDMAEYNYENTDSTAINGKYIPIKMTRIWQHNSDKDLAGYLNMYFTPTVGKMAPELSFGGLYRHKTRDNYYNSYLLKPVIINGSTPRWVDNNSARFEFSPASQGTGAVSTANPNTYTSYENVSSGYVQLKMMLNENLQVLGGARLEHTEQGFTTVMPESFAGRAGTVSYTDLLPSLHFKYALNTKQNLRLSYFRSIVRPDFYEIIPTQDPGELFDIIGNDSLKHSVADNFDLRYELFPRGADQFLVSAFYKRIENPIEYAIYRNGNSSQFFKPQNFGTARNYGVEVVLTKYIGMFGISANYTYTRSRITTTKQYFYRNATSGAIASKYLEQTRPMQGQADHIGNLSVLYKNPKIGLDLQVAYVYTGQRLAQVSPYYELDYYQLGQGVLDFSAEKKAGRHFSIYLKVNNLSNTATKNVILQTPPAGNKYPDQEYNEKIVVGKDLYRINFLAGVRFKL